MKAQITILVLVFHTCFGITGIFAQNTSSSDWVFRENRGQLKDETNSAVTNIKYYGHQGNVNVYCKPGAISFVFTKIENKGKVSEATGQLSGQAFSPESITGLGQDAPVSSNVTMSNADLVLINSNPLALISATDKQEYYENYYNAGNANDGITDVRTFKTVTYQNVYPHIDLVLHSITNGMKYEFVVNPGGRVKDIQMQWNGLKNIKGLENGGISYAVALGKMEETSPYTYQNDGPVKSYFTRKGNRVGFETGNYDKAKTLVIDPSLMWTAYCGGSASDISEGVTSDTRNNVCITGYTSSASGIATSGAYRTSLAGQSDAFVAKYNATGKLLWASYYGGSDNDFGHGIATDSKNNIFITGWTQSASGIATSGAHQTKLTQGNGVNDAFLAKFDSTGKLSWGTYYGGSDNDYGRGITIDYNDNIYITGESQSKSGIATSGAHQTSIGGEGDVFVAQFTSSGSLSWGTYYGGTMNDWGLGITHDASNYIYITGYTQSKNGIASANAYQTDLAGGKNFGDAFVAKFTPAGSMLWGTYYGGSADEEGYAIVADAEGVVYVTGFSQSASGIATAGAYQTGNASGLYKIFVAKFSAAGGREWGTYYGGNAEDVGEAIAIDDNSNIYVTGYTNSSTGIATSGAYRAKPAGTFIIKLATSGSLYWGTYSTGSYGDGIIAGNNNNIFITGAYQENYAGMYDAFLSKFHSYDNDASLISVPSPSGTICGGPAVVKVQLKNTGNRILNTDSIYWKVNGQVQKPIKWQGALAPDSIVSVALGQYTFSGGLNISVGLDTIIAWTAKPNGVTDSFPGNDTANTIIKVNPAPIASAGADKNVCSGTSNQIGMFTYPGTAYVWTSNPKGFSSRVSNPSVNPVVATTYYLADTIQATGCYNSDSVVVTVIPKLVANAGSNQGVCIGRSVQIGAPAVTGYTYSWASSPKGFKNASANPSISPAVTTTYYLTTTNSCESKTDTVLINVNPNPNPRWKVSKTKANLSFVPEDLKEKVYQWHFGSGDSSTIPSPVNVVIPNGSISVSLQVTSSVACTAEYDSDVVVDLTGISLPGQGEFNLKVSPNPFVSTLDISYALPESQSMQLTISDITGKVIANIANENQTGEQHKYIFDAEKYNMPAGIYFLHLVAGGETVTEKVVKLR